MSRWRREASERLPEFQSIIASKTVDGPMMLWIELNLKFEKLCCEKTPPVDLLRRTWHYCDWCLIHGGIDVRTAAALGFCEHLIDTPERTQILPRIMGKSDFTALKCALLYHNDEQTYGWWLRKLWPHC